MMQAAPTVSIVIPAYNQSQYLAEAIQSALAQTYSDFEVIVVDDGSTDATPDVAGRFGGEIRYVWQENQGLAGARNTGIREAKGQFVALLDSDDAWLPNFLEKMMALATAQPEAAVYYCNVCYMDANGRELPQSDNARVEPPENMYYALLRANFLVPSTILMRRNAIVAGGMFDPDFRRLQDWECWLRLMRQGYSIAGTKDRLVRYRVHGGSLSTDPTGGQRAAMAMAVKLFGPDDGRPQTWPADKRRVYGGVYRYHVISFVQRQDAWRQSLPYLRRALHADPTIALDLDLFYELALSTQPLGQRGGTYPLDLDKSEKEIKSLLAALFDGAEPALISLRRRVYATAYYALGLVAYNAGHFSNSRRLLWRALSYRPRLWLDRRLLGNLLKTFIGRSTLRRLRQILIAARSG